MAEPKELLQLYQEGLTLGNEMLSILAAPITGDGMGRLAQAIEQRRQLLERCSVLIRSTPPDEELIKTIQDLLRQNRVLEQAMEGQLERMRQESGTSHRARQTLQGVQRILNSGPRSRLVDQRR